EVTAQCLRVGQNRLTRQAAIKTDGQRFCRHLVQLQITAQLFTCWSRYCCSAFDRQHDDAASTLKDRHRKSGDAGLLGAAIPRNQYIPSHLKLGHWRRNQDRSAAFNVRRWGDPGGVSPFHEPPLGERSDPWSLSSIMRTAKQARPSAAYLSDERNALLPFRCAHKARRSQQLQHDLPAGELQRIVMHIWLSD